MTLRSIMSHHKDERSSRKERRNRDYESRRAIEVQDPSSEIVDRILPQLNQRSHMSSQSAYEYSRSHTWSHAESINSYRASTASLSPVDWSYDTPSCLMSPTSSIASKMSRNLSTTSSRDEPLAAKPPSRPRPFSYVPGADIESLDYYSASQHTVIPYASVKRKPVPVKQNSVSDNSHQPAPSTNVHVSASLTSPFTMDNPYDEHVSLPVPKKTHSLALDLQKTRANHSEDGECTTRPMIHYLHPRQDLVLIPEEG